MFLGSQVSGILSILSFIYFLGKRFYLKQSGYKLNIILILSFIMYLASMTQTTNLLLGFVLLFLIIFVPRFIGISNIILKTILILLLIIIFLIASEFIFRDLIFYKLHEQKDIEIYINTFVDPYNVYKLLEFKKIILGIGRSPLIDVAPTDLGFFGILFLTGLPYFLVITSFIIYCILLSYKNFLNNKYTNYHCFLFLINALFIFIYWGSLIHYTNSIELGLREIFAFQIAFFFQLQKKYIDDK